MQTLPCAGGFANRNVMLLLSYSGSFMSVCYEETSTAIFW